MDTPIRIQQNMHFLKESWDTLADKEGDEIDAILIHERNIDSLIQREDQRNIEELGFKIVTNRKKRQKTQKSSYATRSKGDYPNPFRWSASHGTLEGFPIKVGLKEVTSYS